MITKQREHRKQELLPLSERRFTMADQLITAGEAAQVLGVTLDDIPANKCITKAEFELLAGIVQLTVVPNPSDATVKLNGTVATSIKVTKGTSVTIEVSKSGYQTHTETVTVNATMTKNITLSNVPSGAYVPSNAPVGIYILSTDGFAYKRSAWNTANNSKAVGVGVKTSNCSFVIAPEEQTSIQWGGYGTLISGCTTTTSSDTAKIDYKGKQNTDAIIAQLGAYKALATGLDMDNIVSNVSVLAESIPVVIPEHGEIISELEYNTLVEKQESGETLTPEEQKQLSEYRDEQIRLEFKEKYNIVSDPVLYLAVSEMRTQMKEMIVAQQEIMTLPEMEGGQPLPITTTDIDNMSDEGIMLLDTRASEQYAANYCRNYAFKNGAVGYQPALGELFEAYQNKSEVDACMSLIGGKALYDSSISNYRKWSSTQYDSNIAWNLNWDNGNISYHHKNYSNIFDCARPFAAFQ